MRLLIPLLKIAIAILFLLLCFIVMSLADGARGGPEDDLVIGGYLLFGISISSRVFIGFAALYIILFLLPAIGLAVGMFFLMGQC